MPKLSPQKPHVIIKKLRALGFEGPFAGGRHSFMRHPKTRLKIPVPVHKGKDIPRGTYVQSSDKLAFRWMSGSHCSKANSMGQTWLVSEVCLYLQNDQ